MRLHGVGPGAETAGSLTSVLGENLPLEILSFSASRMAYFDSGSSISLMEMSSMHQLSATSLASFDMASVVGAVAPSFGARRAREFELTKKTTLKAARVFLALSFSLFAIQNLRSRSYPEGGKLEKEGVHPPSLASTSRAFTHRKRVSPIGEPAAVLCGPRSPRRPAGQFERSRRVTDRATAPRDPRESRPAVDAPVGTSEA